MRTSFSTVLALPVAGALFLAGLGPPPALAGERPGDGGRRPQAASRAPADGPAAAAAPRARMPEQQRELLLKLAHSYAAAGRHKEAAVQYRRLADAFPEDIRYRIGLAGALKNAHEFDGAIAVYRAVLAVKPDNVEALVGVGQCHAWQDESVEGVRDLRKVLERDPANLQARIELGRLYVARRYYVGARTCLAELKGLTPRDASEQAAIDEAEETLRRVEILTRPRIGPRASAYGTSARFERSDFGAAFHTPVYPGVEVGFEFDHSEFRQAADRLDRDSPRVTLTYVPDFNLRFEAGVACNRYGDREATTSFFAGGDYEPFDRIRLQASVRKIDLVDGNGGSERGAETGGLPSNGGASMVAIRRHLEDTLYTIAADENVWRPWLVYGRLTYGDLDGGNNHQDMTAGTSLDVWQMAGLAGGHAVRAKYGVFRTVYAEEDPDYFSPEEFVAHGPSLEYEFNYTGDGDGLRLLVEPGFQWLALQRKSSFSLHGGAWWRINEHFSVEVQAFYVDQTLPFRSKAVMGSFSYRF